MKKTAAVLGLILWSLLFLGGCRFIKIEEEPRKPLEYSIVKQENLPAELTALIEEKKGKEFQMTYQSEKELFLIKGYGQQPQGGFGTGRTASDSGGRTGCDLPGHIFQNKTDRTVRYQNYLKSAVLSLYCGKDGLQEGTCDF